MDLESRFGHRHRSPGAERRPQGILPDDRLDGTVMPAASSAKYEANSSGSRRLQASQKLRTVDDGSAVRAMSSFPSSPAAQRPLRPPARGMDPVPSEHLRLSQVRVRRPGRYGESSRQRLWLVVPHHVAVGISAPSAAACTPLAQTRTSRRSPVQGTSAATSCGDNGRVPVEVCTAAREPLGRMLPGGRLMLGRPARMPSGWRSPTCVPSLAASAGRRSGAATGGSRPCRRSRADRLVSP